MVEFHLIGILVGLIIEKGPRFHHEAIAPWWGVGGVKKGTHYYIMYLSHTHIILDAKQHTHSAGLGQHIKYPALIQITPWRVNQPPGRSSSSIAESITMRSTEQTQLESR